MTQQLLKLENLSKYYTGKQSVVVGLDKLNLSFRRGEFVAVTGESGSGKSTLSHVLGGILPYESGELYFGGSPTSHFDGTDWERYRRDQISFISQNYGILPGATVMGNVTSALRLTGMNKQEAAKTAQDILKQVELWDFRSRRAAKLSSGQKQRLSIARALAKPAPILIADEPTGNLDPENSVKVMELLAQAAKDRLVILVTHEFPEAEPYATRHIVLQDGRVIMDAQLHPAPEAAPLPQRPKNGTKLLSVYVAALQQRSRPVWTSLMIAFFAITAFSVFAFLGTFIVNVDDAGIRKYESSAFRNGSPTRIVVSTPDHTPMTQDDYEKLVNIRHVLSLEPNSYAADAQYAYREGTDYSLHFESNNAYTANMGFSIAMSANAPALQTVPIMPQGTDFLTAGRLPENFYEAVAVAHPDQIGKYVSVHITDSVHWSANQIISIPVKIVGVTDYGQGLYFHSDVGRIILQGACPKDYDRFYLFVPNESLDNETFLSNWLILSSLRANSKYKTPVIIPGIPKANQYLTTVPMRSGNAANKNDPDAYTSLSLPMLDPQLPYSEDLEKNLQANGHQCSLAIEVSPENFDKLTWNKASEQVSLTIADYGYTDRVMAQVQKLGYNGTSVYRLGSTEIIEEKAQERDQTLKICLTALISILLLQVILLRAMFANQTGDYKLLSNIGLTCATAMRSILVQLVILTFVGQLLAGTALWICAVQGVEAIRNIMVHLPISYVILLVCVHDVVSVLGITWVLVSLKKQVYPLEGKDSDLDMDEMEVTAV